MATAATAPAAAAAAALRRTRRRILPFSPRLQKRFASSSSSSSSSASSPRASFHRAFRVVEEGRPETLEHRFFFFPADPSANSRISPWHDIPLRAGDGALHCVVEIPRGTRAKMEVATTERHNPIKQDTRMGKLRYYPNNINWNYGMLPQTWEDPSFANTEIEGAFGDNDPVDVVEIGGMRVKIGDVIKVKPLAAVALIDEGELDWKIVAISLDHPRASLVNDANDVEKHFPGTLTAIREWYRDYKIPEGKPPNRFGFSNKALNKDYALEVITKTNESWRNLVEGSVPSGELSLV
ncbi:soluble inorganic pyrophosphatase 6, chloroplastic-like [Ananas comosus]|uniref:inorganic diphosphatase n=1 Tax=Ananas comosus TaxID=4615 RepID=A0A6P5ES53_ANACO|nr:soluble inorganic pyrophosphatase 6, chloroplastic-like [Ananas comosus]